MPQYYGLEPPAKRLVLFVADGLRADTVFSLNKHGTSPAPFIREMIELEGRWGVSHTHVPTESRPGHVALIAGFYEDVSAVTRGWQENPVEFDSVFNQSRHTWSWGSPDILPMFAKGAASGRVDTFMYDAALEDFADSDPSKLDTWVFERVKEMFERSKLDSHLAQQLQQDKIVFFLHLLGIDTNGHAHRPNSVEVIENLRLVDIGIKTMVDMINTYYGDDKTAYVFTSDHGMTDWGSHGAGLPDETMTPIVCWGAGIKSPHQSSHSNLVYHDGWSEKWQLDKYERLDVEQADITALMSTLIGIPIPLNSEGVLPIGYIHYNKAFSAEGLFANFRQLLEQLRIKEQRIYSNSLPLMFRPFSKFSISKMVEERIKINKLIKEKQHQLAIDLSKQLIEIVKEGIRYYHTYHRISLFVVMTFGFCGWIMCVVVTILQENAKRVHPIHGSKPSNTKGVPTKTLAFMLLTFFVLLYQSCPFLYYFYYTLPTICWSYVWRQKTTFRHVYQLLKQNPTRIFKVFVAIFFVLCGLEFLVLSFFFRRVLSIILLLVSLWPYFTTLVSTHLKLCVAWTVSCLLLAVFPHLPVVGRDANYTFVVIAGGFASLACLFLLSFRHLRYTLSTPGTGIPRPIHLLVSQCVLLLISSFIPAVTNQFFAQKESIPVLINVFSWFNLLFSLTSLHFGPKSLPGRLLHIMLSLYTVFILLSTSFEALFLLLLCVTLYLWLSMEELLADKNRTMNVWESIISFSHPKVVTLFANESLERSTTDTTHNDIRQVFFCIFFGILSFFGVGNIASINTFDPATVYCFLTVFSPFVMGALILWKMVVPFIFVSCVFNTIISTLKRSLKTNVLIMLIMSDIMGLNFFFLVRDSGSWLEIGMSISHYIIMMTMIIGIVLLIGVARLLTGVTVIPRKIEDHLY